MRVRNRGEILDAGAEIRAEILLEIRNPKYIKLRKFVSRELAMCNLMLRTLRRRALIDLRL